MPQTVQTLGAFGFASVYGYAKEVTFGTNVAASAYLPVVDSQITVTNKLIKRMGARKTVGQTISSPGQIDVKGTVDCELEPDSLGNMLGYAMGLDTTTGPVSSAYTHVFTLAAPRDSFTLSMDYAKGSVYQFGGVKVDSLDLSCKPNSFLTGKYGVIAQDLTVLSSTSLSPTYGSYQPFAFENISYSTLNAVPISLSSFSISLKNNLKPYFGSGSGRTCLGIDETNAQVTGSFTLDYTNDNVTTYLNSAASTTLDIRFTHPTLPYTLEIYCPNIIIESAPLDPKRSDVTTINAKFSAFESTNGAADDLKITLVNTTSTNYGA